MQSTNGYQENGSYQNYDQQNYQQENESSSEVFYQLVQAGVSEDVASQVDRLVTGGILTSSDITPGVSSALVNLPTDLMTHISNELSASDVSNLKNKAAYLIGLIKTQKKKVPGLATADSNMAGGDQGGAVDINQLNITYGKHYDMTRGLGPNVNEESLKRLLARTGYKLELSPGQRQYGPPPNWQGGRPPKGSEVFIGGLLRETFEDSLVPMLEECGSIFDLRMMTNPADGVNKGFGFCIFTTPEAAKACVSRLNGKNMGRSRTLKVNVHNPNTRLFVGGVDKSKDKTQIMHAISQHTDGLEDVILKIDSEHPYNKHRGFVFLDYAEHKQASVAIKKLLMPTTYVFGKNLFADWAEPESEVSDEVMATVKVLYVKGLSSAVTEEILRDRFTPYGSIDSVKRMKDYAFVHFQLRDDAMQAMNDLNGMKIEDCNIEVTLAKPGNRKKKDDFPGGRGGFGGPGMRGGRGGGMMGGRGGGMMGGRGAPRGAPMRGGPRGGRGAPPPGRGFGAPRGRGGPRAPAPSGYGGASSYGGGASSYGADDYDQGYEARGSYGGGAGGFGGSPSYRAPAPSAAGGRGRGAPRGSPRGAPRGRGVPGAVRGGIKRPAAPTESSYGSYGSTAADYGSTPSSSYGASAYSTSSYGASSYETPAMKRTKSYDEWGAAPIAQQPLTQSYGAGASALDNSWYSDQY